MARSRPLHNEPACRLLAAAKEKEAGEQERNGALHRCHNDHHRANSSDEVRRCETEPPATPAHEVRGGHRQERRAHDDGTQGKSGNRYACKLSGEERANGRADSEPTPLMICVANSSRSVRRCTAAMSIVVVAASAETAADRAAV